jgi:hypothetical protein
MYSIQTWIYGSPINKSAVLALSKHLKIDLEDKTAPYSITPELSLETLYSGSSEYPPRFIGFILSETDECADYIKIDFAKQTVAVDHAVATPLTPTPAQIAVLTAWYTKLPLEVRKCIPVPGHYIVFSTS